MCLGAATEPGPFQMSSLSGESSAEQVGGQGPNSVLNLLHVLPALLQIQHNKSLGCSVTQFPQLEIR